MIVVVAVGLEANDETNLSERVGYPPQGSL
jgi:hypothetical protein